VRLGDRKKNRKGGSVLLSYAEGGKKNDEGGDGREGVATACCYSFLPKKTTSLDALSSDRVPEEMPLYVPKRKTSKKEGDSIEQRGREKERSKLSRRRSPPFAPFPSLPPSPDLIQER